MAEKTRQILRLSIVILFVLAIFFFLMIFLLGLAKKQALQNQVYDNVTVQQQQYSLWGQIPGDL